MDFVSLSPLRLNRYRTSFLPKIVEKEGKIFTLDNRRLKAYQDAGVDIPFVKLDHIPKKQLFKFTTDNDGVDIIIIIRGE